MSFSNYAQSFMPFPLFYDSTCLPLPYYAYLLPDSLPSDSPQPLLAPLPPQPPSKQFPWQKLEALLTSQHAESTQHRKTHWTAEEDALLSRLVEVERKEWKEIPNFFAGRTQNMCYSRYRRISLSCRDRSWTRSEEETVIRLVSQCGEKWKLISARLPKFTAKQIRERFLNYLRPHISKGEFSLQEDLAICKYVLQNGKHWRKMEQLLPGRSEGCIKGRYYGKLQKIINDLADSPSL